MDAVEQLATQIFETAERRDLVEWDVAPRQGAVDFRCVDAPTLSLEVKRLTHQDFHTALARVNQAPSFVPSGVLSRHWHVTLTVPTNGSHGPLVDVRALPQKLESLLVQLEQRGTFHTRGALPFFGPVAEIEALTCGGLALGHPPAVRMPPGIMIAGHRAS